MCGTCTEKLCPGNSTDGQYTLLLKKLYSSSPPGARPSKGPSASFTRTLDRKRQCHRVISGKVQLLRKNDIESLLL